MHPKTTSYATSFDGQTKWIYYLIKDDDLLKNIILFGIKSVPISKKNLTAGLSIIKNFWKPK